MSNADQTIKSAETNLSVSWVNNLTKDGLKTVLKAASLTVEGSVDDLRQRFNQYLQTSRSTVPISTSSLNTPPPTNQFSIAKICNQVRKWELAFDNNSDPISFLERLEELCHCYEIKDHEMLTALPLVFRDDTLLWYRNSKSKWSSWEKFLDDFKMQYLHPRYSRIIAEEIRSRRQGPKESFKNYLTALNTLMRRGKPMSVFEQYDRIYDNMNPDYKLYIRYDSTASITELYQRAIEFEQVTAEQRKFVECSPKINMVNQNNHKETTDRPQQQTHQNNALSTGKRRYDSLREIPHKQPKLLASEPRKLLNPHERCWRCTQKGHGRKWCTNPQKLFCGRCGTTGILGRDCRCQGIVKKRRFTNVNNTEVSDKNTPAASQTVSQNDHDKRIFVNVNINGTTYKALVDSGASTSCIDKKTADSCHENGILYEPNTVSDIFLADGRVVKPLGNMKIPIRINDKEMLVNFLVMPGCGPPVILGMDILAVFGAMIDIRNKKISFAPITNDSSPIIQLSSIDSQKSVSAAGGLLRDEKTCKKKKPLAEARYKSAKPVNRCPKPIKRDLPKKVSWKFSKPSKPSSSSQPSSHPETGMILHSTYSKVNLCKQIPTDANKPARVMSGPVAARSFQTFRPGMRFIGPILPKPTRKRKETLDHGGLPRPWKQKS